MALAQHRYDEQQGGFVSIVSVFFVIVFVLFILSQALTMLGNKSIDSIQYMDSVRALYIAESGAERAMGMVSLAVASDDSQMDATCSAIHQTTTPIAFGGGSFTYTPLTSPQAPAGSCDIRVMGRFNSASRSIQIRINLSSEIGTAGFGHDIMMRLQNNLNVPGVAVFNLAWRRHGSTGHSTDGGQAAASACPLPTCYTKWSLSSSSGQPSVGSLGTAVAVNAQTGADIIQTLNKDRNFAEVGMIMPGLVGAPVLKGSFYDDKRTANTANNTVTKGDTSSGQATGWCAAADTLVFGVSGRGDDDVTGAYSSVVFNSNGSPAQPIPLTWIAHFPNTDGSTPGVFGDVFSEIWYTYNPYAMFSGATSQPGDLSRVNVLTPVSLAAGTLLKVYTGTGAFAGNTRVVSSISNATQFQISPSATSALASATVCGGICALFNNPSSSSSSTEFSLTRTSNAAQQWAGGFTCLSGVDPSKVHRIARSSARLVLWHEITSND